MGWRRDGDCRPVLPGAGGRKAARGRHLAESIGGCLGCHGPDLAGALVEDLGPVGVIYAPNITQGGLGAEYSDGELARAIRHGIKLDGRSMLFMPTIEFNWWPDEDLVAVMSFVRALPPVDRTVEPAQLRPLGKLLNQFGVMQMLSAETVDQGAPREVVPDPEPMSSRSPACRWGEPGSRTT